MVDKSMVEMEEIIGLLCDLRFEIWDFLGIGDVMGFYKFIFVIGTRHTEISQFDTWLNKLIAILIRNVVIWLAGVFLLPEN